ncbi:polyketide synthase dehydratase domain-containing protein, partial [Streptomyces mutabilis]|uniref:polyketide synthase dehydratase domain-containing protein n=1 Tax=Streptomyces mutabilis TaxID=67332 RepID=UPI00368E5518
SLSTHPWLADHTVGGGMVLFPATGFLELAVRAGDQVGCGRVQELTLTTPLGLDPKDAVAVQVRVGPPDASGGRPLGIHCRPADADDDAPWTQHATGVLTPGEHVVPFETPAWPPAGADPVDLTGFYERTEYGPLFQGLRGAWTRGDEVFAELELPDRTDDAALFGLHPALLTAALHAVEYVDLKDADQGLLPFSWSGVTLHASGATRLRVRIGKAGEDSVSIAAADTSGRPVLSVESLALRPSSAARLLGPGAADRTSLRGLARAPRNTASATTPHPAHPTEPASFREHFASLSAAEQDTALLDLVVACAAELLGHTDTAVVLLDTLSIRHDSDEGVDYNGMMKFNFTAVDDSPVRLTNSRLSAMGRWMVLLNALDVHPTTAPVLEIKCTRALIEGVPAPDPERLHEPVVPDATVRPLDADHLSLIREDSGPAADLVEEWLTALESTSDAASRQDTAVVG